MLQGLALSPVACHTKDMEREQPTMTYKLTLQNTLTAEELVIDIEQTDAFEAKKVAEQFYEGYRVTKIVNALDALLTTNYNLTEGALGDF